MEKRLLAVIDRYRLIEQQLADPEIIKDQKQFAALNREYSGMEALVQKATEYTSVMKALRDTAAIMQNETDHEMRQMLHDESCALDEKRQTLEEELTILLLPKDRNSGKDVIIEIRAGTGGEEAALFVSDLFRMYQRYADIHGWRCEILERSQTEIGGLKEIVFSIAGTDVYDDLKYESGTHRVQRVPETESGGRIHTSAVTVAVMPEAEETDVDIRSEDLRVDVYRSSGHGGQSVNTTDSAVRITHIPTGMVVTCQDEKSQLKNKLKAMKVLRARLYEIEESKRQAEESKLRKSQVGSGDRSERIRTYNFRESRVTDHRIGITLYSLDAILGGDMEGLIEPLKRNEIQELLKNR